MNFIISLYSCNFFYPCLKIHFFLFQGLIYILHSRILCFFYFIVPLYSLESLWIEGHWAKPWPSNLDCNDHSLQTWDCKSSRTSDSLTCIEVYSALPLVTLCVVRQDALDSFSMWITLALGQPFVGLSWHCGGAPRRNFHVNGRL